MKRNVPCELGEQFGKELARLSNAGIHGADDRCGTCAFRLGTVPNKCLQTVATALECVIAEEEFTCHESHNTCRGWISSQVKGA